MQPQLWLLKPYFRLLWTFHPLSHVFLWTQTHGQPGRSCSRKAHQLLSSIIVTTWKRNWKLGFTFLALPTSVSWKQIPYVKHLTYNFIRTQDPKGIPGEYAVRQTSYSPENKASIWCITSVTGPIAGVTASFLWNRLQFNGGITNLDSSDVGYICLWANYSCSKVLRFFFSGLHVKTFIFALDCLSNNVDVLVQ